MKKLNFIKYLSFAMLVSLASCQDDDLPGVGDIEDISGPAPFFTTISGSQINRGCDGVVIDANYEFEFTSGDLLSVNGTEYAWAVTPSAGVNYIDVETRETLEGLENQIKVLRGEAQSLESQIEELEFRLPCDADPVSVEAEITTAKAELVVAVASLDSLPAAGEMVTPNDQVAVIQDQIDAIIAEQVTKGFLADNPTEIPVESAMLDSQNITVALPDAGTYIVALTVLDNTGASETKEEELEVAVPLDRTPASSPNFTSVLVEGTTIQFTNTSERATSFSWDFNNGEGTSTLENPVFTFSEAGAFDVVLTTTNVDGDPTKRTIRIPVGEGVVVVPNLQSVFITDTSSADTGELRYVFDESPILTGRLTVDVNKSVSNGDAFISVFGGAASNTGAILDVRLGEGTNENFLLRNEEITETSSPDFIDITRPAFNPNQFYSLEITWDTTANGTLVTFSVDGVATTSAPFLSAGDNRIVDGASIIAFKFGTNSGFLDGAEGLIVDNVRLYDTSSGSDVEVFVDDFEDYTIGNLLDTTDMTSGGFPTTGTVDPSSEYHQNSFEAVVIEN